MTNFFYRRRFFVLEDSDSDFAEICEFLKSVTIKFFIQKELHIPAVISPSLEVIWSRCSIPQPQSNGGFFTAPLTLAKSDIARIVFMLNKGRWTRHDERRIQMSVVPWLIRERDYPNHFLPHACVLDVITGATSGEADDRVFNEIRSQLRRSGYPSNLVWVFSRGKLPNDEYGIFLPKSVLHSAATNGHGIWSSALLGQLVAHGGPTLSEPDRPSKLKTKNLDRSYLPRTVERFFVDVVQNGAWQRRVRVELNSSGNEEKDQELQRVWRPRENTVHLATIAFSTSLARTRRTFTFFRDDLEEEDQLKYIAFQRFGLPEPGFAFNVFQRRAMDISEIVVQAATAFKGESYNVVVRLNCAILIELLIGTAELDNLNHSLPSLDLGYGQFHNIAKGLIKTITVDKTPDAKVTFKRWFKDVFN